MKKRKIIVTGTAPSFHEYLTDAYNKMNEKEKEKDDELGLSES